MRGLDSIFPFDPLEDGALIGGTAMSFLQEFPCNNLPRAKGNAHIPGCSRGSAPGVSLLLASALADHRHSSHNPNCAQMRYYASRGQGAHR